MIDEKLKDDSNVLSCSEIINKYNFEDYISSFNSVNNNKNYYKKTLFRNDKFELILIRWDKDAETSIHPHPKNGCLLKPIFGKLNETRYLKSNKEKNTELEINKVYYMHDDIGKHKIMAKDDSYSIHLYSPPNFYN